jgi:hypothetical protein
MQGHCRRSLYMFCSSPPAQGDCLWFGLEILEPYSSAIAMAVSTYNGAHRFNHDLARADSRAGAADCCPIQFLRAWALGWSRPIGRFNKFYYMSSFSCIIITWLLTLKLLINTIYYYFILALLLIITWLSHTITLLHFHYYKLLHNYYITTL